MPSRAPVILRNRVAASATAVTVQRRRTFPPADFRHMTRSRRPVRQSLVRPEVDVHGPPISIIQDWRYELLKAMNDDEAIVSNAYGDGARQYAVLRTSSSRRVFLGHLDTDCDVTVINWCAGMSALRGALRRDKLSLAPAAGADQDHDR